MRKKLPDIPRLCQAIRAARSALEFARKERREAVREYVGTHWSEDGAYDAVPVNLLSLFITIMSRQLVPKNPRANLSTFERQHLPTVSAMQQWMNEEVEHINLANTLRRCVIDAFFSIGIMKIGLATPEDSVRYAWNLKGGSAFAERVDLDDFVFDVDAKDFNEVRFIGHRFRAPLDVVKDDKNYDSKIRKKLTAQEPEPYNAEGDEKIGMLGKGYREGSSTDFEDMVDLWEIYLPQYRTVVIIADQFLDEGGVLQEKQWIGPVQGPYRMLAFGIVPGNAMPKSPVQDLIDIHVFCNNVANKLMRQARRQKEILGVQGGADSDADRVTNAGDGHGVRVDNPDKIAQLNFGGPSAKNFQMFMAFRDLFKEMAGNLDAIGGLGPQAKTLGQDRLLNANASRTVADLQEQTIDFVADTMRAMTWYWFHDPYKVMKSTYSVPGLPEMTAVRKVTPRDRMQVKYEDLRLKIDPFSMQYQTPGQRLQLLISIFTKVFVPLAPLLQQNGIGIDMQAFARKVAEFADMPELSEILTIQDAPTMQTGQGGPAAPGKPQSTERNYTRESVSQSDQETGMDTAGEAMFSAEGTGNEGMG